MRQVIIAIAVVAVLGWLVGRPHPSVNAPPPVLPKDSCGEREHDDVIEGGEVIEGGGGIVFSSRLQYAFSVSAPKDWMFDNVAAHQSGAYDLMYPKGQAWSSRRIFMVAKGYPKQDLKTLLDGEGREETLSALQTSQGRTSAVRLIIEPDGRRALVACVALKHAWAVVRQDAAPGVRLDQAAFRFVVHSIHEQKSFQPPETIEIDAH